MGSLIQSKKRIMMMQKQSVINVCPVSTGIEMRSWPSSGGSRKYLLTGLEPNTEYTLQVTITSPWEKNTGRRLYFFKDVSANQFIDTGVQSAPITKTFTQISNADGEINISHNANALNDDDYAASLINIMVEIGSVAHPYVPYNG